MPKIFTVKGISHDLWIDSNVGKLIMAYPIVENLRGYFIISYVGHFDVDRYYLIDVVLDESC